MYCVAFAWKNWYDAKDMRATGGNDVNFAMDAPKFDSPDIAELRAKGAIIYAVANAATSAAHRRGRAGRSRSRSCSTATSRTRAWGGQPCNPYDTERVPRGIERRLRRRRSRANLAACSICEQRSASCKGPASRNNVVNLLTTKGILMDGGIGSKNIGDRAGIHCRTVDDAVRVLDAIKGYESRRHVHGDSEGADSEGAVRELPRRRQGRARTSRSRACASASSASSW